MCQNVPSVVNQSLNEPQRSNITNTNQNVPSTSSGINSFNRERLFSGVSQNVPSIVPQLLSEPQRSNITNTNQNIPSKSSGIKSFNRERSERTLGNFRNLFAPYGNNN